MAGHRASGSRTDANSQRPPLDEGVVVWFVILPSIGEGSGYGIIAGMGILAGIVVVALAVVVGLARNIVLIAASIALVLLLST